MRFTPFALITTATTALVLSVPLAPARAQTDGAAKPAAQNLPAAKEIRERYIAAIGGRDAVMKHNSIRTTGTFEMPAAGVKGDAVIVQGKPDRMATHITIPGMGDVVAGFDGQVAWSSNPMQGLRVLEGKELEQIREDAGLAAMLGDSPFVKSAETIGTSDVGGDSCYQVRVTYNSGRTRTDCFSTRSGLLVGSQSTQDSPMGTVEITTVASDWKDFGGLKVPTKMRQQMMGQEQVITIANVEFDRPDDAAMFEQPDAVKTLVKQSKP